MKSIIDEIKNDVVDVKNKKFEYISTTSVPSRHDTSLTFERGVDKRGKEIKTCVLYVDIRDSVNLNKQHHTQTMGRIYTAFSRAMLKLAKHHKGSVRNIIGDRVMIVFPSDECFTNSVRCAISIHHIAERVINSVFTDVTFKCGIGIDYGKLKVVKVGLTRQGNEGIDNKNLVWVGYPANIASRLTDIANKTIDNSKVEVTYYPYNYLHFSSTRPSLFDLLVPSQPHQDTESRQPRSTYQSKLTTKIHTLEDFAKSIRFDEGVRQNAGDAYIEAKR